MNLGERWERHATAMDDGDETRAGNYAIHQDGSVVIFDEEGYFKIVGTGPGPNPGAPSETVPNVFVLEDATGAQEPLYCEPIWLSGYYETIPKDPT